MEGEEKTEGQGCTDGQPQGLIKSKENIDKTLNAKAKDLYCLKKGLDENNDEIIFLWFDQIERRENSKIVIRV